MLQGHSDLVSGGPLGLALHRPEREALSLDHLDGFRGPRAVGHLASVVLVVQLSEVERQVLPADVIVRPVEAALDVPEEAFRRVGGRKPSRRRVVARVLLD